MQQFSVYASELFTSLSFTIVHSVSSFLHSSPFRQVIPPKFFFFLPFLLLTFVFSSPYFFLLLLFNHHRYTLYPSLFLSCLYLSPVLSALRQVSAITPLHLLIPVLILPSTQQPRIALCCFRTHTFAGCTNVPEEPSSPVCLCSHPLTVQENALCKRTKSINLAAASTRLIL